jgi:tetratricopeptide (TPR) repeat protein
MIALQPISSRPLSSPGTDGSESGPPLSFSPEEPPLIIPESLSPETCYQLGRYLDERGRPEEAYAFLSKAVKKNPHFAEAVNDLGSLFQRKGRLDQASACYARAVHLKPDFPEAHYNLANAKKEMGEWAEAEIHARKALELAPDLKEAWQVLGFVQYEQGKLGEAVQAWEKALDLDPESWVLAFNLGTACYQLDRLEEARRYCEQAAAKNPGLADAHYHLGLVYYGLERIDEALRCWQQALQVNPRHLDALNNLGAVFQEKQQVPRALKCFDTALAVQPDYAEARWNRATCLLLAGDYERGWEEYEWRIEVPKHRLKRTLERPRWQGEPVQGKRVLLYSEQGFGDTFQFARYIPLVMALGARVILECYPEQALLLAGSFPALEGLIIRSQPLPEYDCFCPLPSLPLIFRTRLETIPRNIPYLFPDPALMEKWGKKLDDAQTQLKVGLVWAGRTETQKQRRRPVPFSALASLFTVSGVQFYSLQKGEAAEPLKKSAEGKAVRDVSADLTDFSETAALITQLDLVITIDTAVAHLAGALGKPVWTLLPYAPDWRWLLHRTDSPWYPTMRLFRQTAPGDWGKAVQSVRQCLQDLVLNRTLPDPTGRWEGSFKEGMP